MYASVDFATKKDFRRAVQQGLTVVVYSPTLGMPAVTGTATVVGPWPLTQSPKEEPLIGPKEKRRPRSVPAWMAHVEVKDMRVVAVH
jgi:hypothetical protein